MALPDSLIRELQSLSEPQLGQVIDFVEALRKRDARDRYNWSYAQAQDQAVDTSLSDEVIRQRREA